MRGVKGLLIAMLAALASWAGAQSVCFSTNESDSSGSITDGNAYCQSQVSAPGSPGAGFEASEYWTLVERGMNSSYACYGIWDRPGYGPTGGSMGIQLYPKPCAADSCTTAAGSRRTINVTEGWARSNTPDANDYVTTLAGSNPAWLYADRCEGGCTVQVNRPIASWRSQQPNANGLHRVSLDLDVTVVATPCTPTTAEADPTTAAPACPGYLGYVNGKPVCVGTAASPLPAASAPGGTPPQAPGNPAAGPKPETGPGSGDTGSGRTPLTGSGGNDGGGSSASVPGGGSEGNGQSAGSGEGDEQPRDPCGLPGTAPCRIDESGTPSASGTGAAVSAMTSSDGTLRGVVSGLTVPSSLGWSFGVTIPDAACSPITFGKGGGGTWNVDLCSDSLIAILRTLMAWAAAVAVGVYGWRRMQDAVSGG